MVLGGDVIWVPGTSVGPKWPKNRTPSDIPELTPAVTQIECTCLWRENTPIGLPNAMVDGQIAMTQRCLGYARKQCKMDIFGEIWISILRQNQKWRISGTVRGMPKSFCTFFNLIGDIKSWGSKFWSGSRGWTYAPVYLRRFRSSVVPGDQLHINFSHELQNKNHIFF